MPRGQKKCRKCGTLTGPRAFKCECGELFVIKGEVITRAPKSAYSRKFEDGAELNNEFKVEDFFVEIDYKKDDTNIRCFDGTARCWETPDKAYRVRRAKTFMGINSFDGRHYHLLKRSFSDRVGVQWELLSRHKSMKAALTTFDKVLRGEKVIEPGKRKRSLKKFLKKVGRI